MSTHLQFLIILVGFDIGFGGNGSDDTPEISIGKSSINKDDRALLQEALFDLLECKRLLDQVLTLGIQSASGFIEQ